MLNQKQIEKLANEVFDWLVENRLWIDVRVYYNGKVRYGNLDAGFVMEEKADPKEYFEYVAEPNILSMSFEGALYEVFNGTSARGSKLQEEFISILEKYGLYYELGNAWNLTCYEG